jgi:hypothetical protein
MPFPIIQKTRETELSGLRNKVHYLKVMSFLTPANIIRNNLFFAYNYKFQTRGVPFKKLAFYDWFPLVYVFDVSYGTRHFRALNFHHLPVRLRLIWLTRVKRLYKAKFPTDPKKRNYDKPIQIPLSYRRIVSLLYQSTFAVRQYRMDRVRLLKVVSNNEIDHLLLYHSNTYYAVRST